jgi:hypothetical protein
MGKYLPPFTFKDFSRGMNNKPDANLLDDTELAESLNCYVGRGRIEQRYGYKTYRNTACSYLYEFFKGDGTSEFLVVSGNTLFKDTGSLLVSATMTNSLTTPNVKMITYNDRNMNDVVLIADGGKLKTYNGTEVKEVTPHILTGGEPTDPGQNELANLTAVRTIVINGGRIYLCGHPTNKNRVSFSHIDPLLGYGVYDYIPSTHFFDLAVDDNDEIIDLIVFRGAVIVFCKRSVWAIYGNGRTADDYEIIQINVPTGCISPGSITRVGNAIFYLSDTHVYALTSTEKDYISSNIISENVEKTLLPISLSDKAQATGIEYENRYYLSFPDGTTVVYDNLLDNWTVFTNIKAKSFLNRSGVLYFAGSKLYQFDKTLFQDDGVAIFTRLVFKNMDFGFAVQDKKFRRMWVVAKQYEAPSSTYNISAIIDYVTVNITDIQTDQSFVWGESNWGALWGFKDVVRNELQLGKRGTQFQLIITHNSVDQPFTFYSMSFEFAPKRP